MVRNCGDVSLLMRQFSYHMNYWAQWGATLETSYLLISCPFSATLPLN